MGKKNLEIYDFQREGRRGPGANLRAPACSGGSERGGKRVSRPRGPLLGKKKKNKKDQNKKKNAKKEKENRAQKKESSRLVCFLFPSLPPPSPSPPLPLSPPPPPSAPSPPLSLLLHHDRRGLFRKGESRKGESKRKFMRAQTFFSCPPLPSPYRNKKKKISRFIHGENSP